MSDFRVLTFLGTFSIYVRFTQSPKFDDITGFQLAGMSIYVQIFPKNVKIFLAILRNFANVRSYIKLRYRDHLFSGMT